jgi:HAMP domain-containing protein
VLKKSLLLPVLELARATENISLGRVDQAIVIRSKDELGQLAAAIERMRISIRIAIERLASKKGALPGVEAGEWEDVILEKKQYGFEFLALRILVGRLTVSYRNDPTAETLRKCTQHLINFFQNEKNPQAQKDLTKIFGGAVL